MNIDWKDALSALRNNLDDPQDISDETTVQQSTSQKGLLNIVIDKKGRNGKIATIIEGFTVSSDEVNEIAKILKRKLGVGGSIREGEILIQGEHRDAVRNILLSLNFKFK